MTGPDREAGGRLAFAAISRRQMGLYVLFASLSMLFAASLVGYFITRSQSAIWRDASMPRLPGRLFISTLFLIGVSTYLQGGLRAIRENRAQTMMRRLLLGLGFSLLFLGNQALGWSTLSGSSIPENARSLYAFTFYLLTGLHALHVLGGFVPLGVVLVRARSGEYSSSRHEGVLLCVQYWHFLGVVWAILFTTLVLFS